MESRAVLTTSDWRIPFLEYLIEGILPDNHEEAYHSSDFVSLYKHLQRLGYYWLKMSKQAAIVQEQCTSC